MGELLHDRLLCRRALPHVPHLDQDDDDDDDDDSEDNDRNVENDRNVDNDKYERPHLTEPRSVWFDPQDVPGLRMVK